MTKLERLRQAERVFGEKPTHYADGDPVLVWRSFPNGGPTVYAFACGTQAVIGQTFNGSMLAPIPPSDWEEPLLCGPDGERARLFLPMLAIDCGSLRMFAEGNESVADLIARWNKLATNWQKAKP